MVGGRASRRLLPVLALASGLWMAGCATTETQDDDTPDIGTSIGTIAGQILGQVLAGAAGALGGYAASPDDVVRSPTYSSRAYTQTYSHPVHAPSHRGHRHHR